MTEAEAKTKWCPKALAPLYVNTDDKGKTISFDFGNRDADGQFPSSCACLGSECAMWRWGGKRLPNTSYEPIEGWQHVGIEEAEQCGETREFWREPEAEAEKRRPGWCGLAGRPT